MGFYLSHHRSLTILFYLNALLHIEQQGNKGIWVTYDDDCLSSRWDPSRASENSFGFLFTRFDSPAQSEVPCTAFRTRESQEAVVEFLNEMENTPTIDRVNVSVSAPRAGNVFDEVIRLFNENSRLMIHQLSMLQQQQNLLQQQQKQSDDDRFRTLRNQSIATTGPKRQRTSPNPSKQIQTKRRRIDSNLVDGEGAFEPVTPVEWITQCPIMLDEVTRDEIYVHGW